jgi:hypothetical protein
MAFDATPRKVATELAVCLGVGFEIHACRVMRRTRGMTEADCGNDASGVGDSLVFVAAIGEDISHEGIKCAGSAEEGDETVAALNARGMQLGCERATARHD